MDPPLLRSSSPANVLDSIAAVLTDFLVSDIPLSKAIELSHVGSFALLDLVWMRSIRDAIKQSIACRQAASE
ncbi:hypothetical protein PC129_g16682 [Phytophthora cactorum]|uniref:Uncharacterized protein n=1 Tax=Phytophthora cactorum TaxID=29920 RepID=A0A329RNB3_9STRA|nr:hypothetical protein Pcac1_g14455 [Phytophthora cactorum]KAG2805744.1 hypothetical protein PC112_g18138 [Phytophthora cactorum]KAG2806098.1 hypothetical protein PC111_g17520 [Phytophthora cactorum]KAG2845988.1 hypothetical protein PC113_g18068 [Phytophthora cactorum]KAG2885407.1 hypothetical protein PC114_g19687 [Phytophthora cactorum]